MMSVLAAIEEGTKFDRGNGVKSASMVTVLKGDCPEVIFNSSFIFDFSMFDRI